ncbi:LysR family transcriptional regulator [Ferrimonas balearica]|uniref:LysR family transcriptional regulator n=1 Tax=Ferrimonas balearica TaxID=44012 RepID=UPI001C992C45|nr:LysR family transcriptional regulator [Ferrimonas balearica]MBY5991602.1 LysR family transcriptional regulator [Ferrimonas balearica]
MDTEALKLFVTAAERLNISAAGRQLGLAPAVASARLSKLEQGLGVELLHRSTRKVALSPEGAKFLPFARAMLAQEDAALAALGHGCDEITGTLRFAASSTFAQLFVAPILPEFLAQHPSLNVELHLSDNPVNLVEGGYDLALRNYAIPESGLRARKLAEDTRILCASPDYLAKQGTPKTPQDLADHQLLVFMDGHGRKLANRNGEPVGTFPPNGAVKRVICDDGTSMRIATEAGIGISMNAHWSVYRALAEGRLVRVLPDHEVMDNTAIWLVYPKSQVVHAKVRAFIDFLLDKVGDPPLWTRFD